MQVMLSTGKNDGVPLQRHSTRLPVLLDGQLPFVPGQFHELSDDAQLLGSVKQEVVIKTEDIVADDDIGIFALDHVSPGQ